MDLPPVADDFRSLVERCDSVEAHLPELHVEFAEPRRFEAAFAAIASALLANAERIDGAPEDPVAYVRGRLDAMLAKESGGGSDETPAGTEPDR